MEMLAHDIATVLDQLNINAPILAGLSMGGYVALSFCQKYARWLSGLILVSTRASADTKEQKANRDKMAMLAKEPEGKKLIIETMLPKMMSPKTYEEKPELVAKVKSIMETASIDGIVGASMGMKGRSDYTTFLSSLDLPTLVIHGADDQLVSTTEAEILAKHLPKGKLHIIENAGHLPNMEQSEQFNKIIRDFILNSR
jgi:pimeloyl-ACP methyl ester carboxylesterase